MLDSNDYNGIYDNIMKNISELPDVSDIERQEGIAIKTRKANWFIRLLKYLFPWKGDKPAEVVRKIIFFIALVVFIAMLCIVIPYYIEPFFNANLTNELRSKYTASEGYSSPEINPKFAELYAQNNDLAGWITISGTNINYPVMHTDKMKGSDDYYLRTDFNKKYSRYGSIFAERTNNLGYMTESKNITLYGHNMKDDSTMFGQLLRYSNLEFYKKHPLITFDTLYRDGKWKIFSVIITNSTPEENNGYVFDYRKSDFTSDEQFLYWANEVKKRSIINTPVQIEASDEILTLQTCTYEFDNARYVVFARRVRSGESLVVNVDAATMNSDAVYPQGWYDYLGEENPHPNEHSELVAATTQPTTVKSREPATYASSTTKAKQSTTKTNRTNATNYKNKNTVANSTTTKTTSAPTTTKPPSTTVLPTESVETTIPVTTQSEQPSETEAVATSVEAEESQSDE